MFLGYPEAVGSQSRAWTTVGTCRQEPAGRPRAEETQGSGLVGKVNTCAQTSGLRNRDPVRRQ